MAIDVEIQDERGGTIARYEGPALGLGLLKLAPANGPCFRFIIPWADTTFNQEQIPVLIDELRDASSRTAHPERQSELKALIDFVERARNSMHTYVKFIGD